MDGRLTEKVISRQTVFDGRVVHLEKWTVQLPNGKDATREVIRHVGAAAVLAIGDGGEVYMVRQFRAALGCVTLEIPAGKLNSPSDDPLLGAQRELSEETGLTATSWRHLSRIFTSVGFCDEKIDLYLATGLSQGEAHPDEDEFVQVLKIPYAELLRRAMAGEISDAKTVCALTLARPYTNPND